VKMYYKSHPSWRSKLHALSFVFAFAGLSLWVLFANIHFPSFIINPLVQAGVAPKSVATVISGFFAFVTFVLFSRFYIKRIYYTYMVRDSHLGLEVAYNIGIVSRNMISIKVADIRSINVDQSLIQRLMGIGDITFSSATASSVHDDTVMFENISRPVRLRAYIESLQLKDREDRKRHEEGLSEENDLGRTDD